MVERQLETPLHINVIGLGVTATAELSSDAKRALHDATMVIGWQRHQEIIEHLLQSSSQSSKSDLKDTFHCVKTLQDVSEAIDTQRRTTPHESIVVLASGDPLFFGIGRWLIKRFAPQATLQFFPAVSSIQAACHLQQVSLQDVEVVSLHGRPLTTLRRRLKRNGMLAILTDEHSNPFALAQEAIAAGFTESIITVHENLGYPSQQSRSFTVTELCRLMEQSPDDAVRLFAPLHVSLLDVKGVGRLLPEFPGIPDQHFITGAAPGKGMISKREVRLAILSFMQPAIGDCIWDIGAGCGGVSVELAYWCERAVVYGIECHEARLACLHDNRERFGVTQNLNIIEGRAPDVLADLPKPNKIFIGGSDGELENLLPDLWQLLPEQGVLVASAVIASTKQQLQQFAEQLTGAEIETVEIAVKRGNVEQGALCYQHKLPVEIFKLTKQGTCHES